MEVLKKTLLKEEYCVYNTLNATYIYKGDSLDRAREVLNETLDDELSNGSSDVVHISDDCIHFYSYEYQIDYRVIVVKIERDLIN